MIIRKIINKLFHYLKGINHLSVSAKSTIDKTVSLYGATITGNVILEEGCNILGGVRIAGGSLVRVGRYTYLNGPNTDIVANINAVHIGAFCSIARNVTIQESNHYVNRVSTYFMNLNIHKKKNLDEVSKGDITIGSDVWIGTHSVILSGAKIGHGAVIAANSVVTGEIPPYAIAGGTPARVLKYRFEKDVIDRFLTMEWWNWDIEKIKENKLFFEKEVSSKFLDEYTIL